jgi:ElaB/YqjD/DUF883 family membrane-anchored ribosome-binding protein
MFGSKVKTVQGDVKSLVEGAQELFREATAATGAKADELRSKGLKLLDTAVSSVQDVQETAIEKTKEIAATTNECVQENPWKAVAVSAGIGLIAGVCLARK